jgi:hypothetical protein
MKFTSSFVKPTNSLKVKKLEVDICKNVEKQLKDMDLSKLKVDPDVILFIANQIENAFNSDKEISYSKIDKKSLFFDILKKIVPDINSEEEEIISAILEHLHSSGRIKKLTTWGFLKSLPSYFLKKKD